MLNHTSLFTFDVRPYCTYVTGTFEVDAGRRQLTLFPQTRPQVHSTASVELRCLALPLGYTVPFVSPTFNFFFFGALHTHDSFPTKGPLLLRKLQWRVGGGTGGGQKNGKEEAHGIAALCFGACTVGGGICRPGL